MRISDWSSDVCSSDLFVDLMRWSVPVVDDHYEIDQFDNAEAVYLIAIEGGEHIGSMRLLSTERPHILDTLFPDLCADGPQIGRATSELQSLMRISYAVFCLKKKKKSKRTTDNTQRTK